MRLILASTSPRRRELLAGLGIPFECVAPSVDESRYGTLPPRAQAETLARLKAESVAAQHPHAVVLGGDTLVVLHGVVFGKPTDAADAQRMLQQLQGKTHEVITAIAVVRIEPPLTKTCVETACVTMRALTPEAIAVYVATGESLDKAGAYGVQGLGGTLIAHVDGDYHTVVGLPLPATADLLRDVMSPGVKSPDDKSP